MSWTDERVELLKKLWTDGLTASQIASKLGGVSRNAVIGKVHRLKLEARGRPAKSTTPKPRKPALARGTGGSPSMGTRSSSRGGHGASSGVSAGARTMQTVTHTVGATVMKTEVEAFEEFDQRPIEDIVVPIARKLTLVEISETTCKYPYGDPLTDDFYFCGHDIKEGSPYCTYHSKLAFQQPDRKRRR